MSDENVRTFDRIISFRSLAQWQSLPAVICAFLSSLFLAIAFVSAAALFWLLVYVSPGRNDNVARFTGLQPLAESIASHPIGGAFARLIRSVSLLHSNGFAVLFLFTTICISVVLRWAFQSVAKAHVENRVSEIVQRLRQHIHRSSIRLDPSDISGEQANTADRLFRETTVFLETAGSRWGSVVLTAAADAVVLVIVALLANWRVAMEAIVPVLLIRFAIRYEMHRSDSSLRLLSELGAQLDRE